MGQQLEQTVMLGPSAAVVGVVLLTLAGFGPVRERRARLLLLSRLAMMALYSGMLGDVLRLGTGLLGLMAGKVTVGRTRDSCADPEWRAARASTSTNRWHDTADWRPWPRSGTRRTAHDLTMSGRAAGCILMIASTSPEPGVSSVAAATQPGDQVDHG